MSTMHKTTHRLFIPLLLGLLWLNACGPSQAEVAEETYQEGMHAFNQGDFGKAHDRFEAAIAQDSTYAKAYLGRGILQWRDNHFETALPDFNKAIHLDSTLTMAYYYRGASLVSLQRYEQSLADFEQVFGLNDLPREDMVRTHRWHGIALLNLERYEEALPDFTRCVELEPENPFHRLERGRIYEYVGQTQHAMEDYTAVLALSDGDGEGEMVAEAQQRLEKLTGSQEALQK